jgi:hypothetical protein
VGKETRRMDCRSSKLLSAPNAARAARLAPFMLAGPISGPLLAGVILNLRGGQPVLGSLYAVALGLWAFLMPVLAVKVL